MEHAKIVEGIDLAALFAAGAASALDGMNVTEKQAEAFVTEVCKEAAFRREDYDDDEEDTFWGRNKGWLLPAIVGAVAFKLGASAGKHGKPWQGDLANAWDNVGYRLSKLFNLGKGTLEKALSVPGRLKKRWSPGANASQANSSPYSEGTTSNY